MVDIIYLVFIRIPGDRVAWSNFKQYLITTPLLIFSPFTSV